MDKNLKRMQRELSELKVERETLLNEKQEELQTPYIPTEQEKQEKRVNDTSHVARIYATGVLADKFLAKAETAAETEERIQRELPQGLGFIRRRIFLKQRRRYYNEKKIREEAERDRFSSFFMDEDAKIRSQIIDNVDIYENDAFISTFKTLNEDVDYSAAETVNEGVLARLSDRSPEIASKIGSLCEFLDGLKAYDIDRIGEDDAKLIVSEFRKLGLSEAGIGEQQLDDNIFHIPGAALVFAAQAAGGCLLELVNGLGEDNVNAEHFTRLHAFVRCMDTLGTSLYTSKAFHEKRKQIRDSLIEEKYAPRLTDVDTRINSKNEEIDEEEKALIKLRQVVAVRRRFLATGRGLSEVEDDENYALGAYADFIEAQMGTKFYKLKEKEFSKEIYKYRLRLNNNMNGLEMVANQIITDKKEAGIRLHEGRYRSLLVDKLCEIYDSELVNSVLFTEKETTDAGKQISTFIAMNEECLREARRLAEEDEELLSEDLLYKELTEDELREKDTAPAPDLSDYEELERKYGFEVSLLSTNIKERALYGYKDKKVNSATHTPGSALIRVDERSKRFAEATDIRNRITVLKGGIRTWNELLGFYEKYYDAQKVLNKGDKKAKKKAEADMKAAKEEAVTFISEKIIKKGEELDDVKDRVRSMFLEFALTDAESYIARDHYKSINDDSQDDYNEAISADAERKIRRERLIYARLGLNSKEKAPLYIGKVYRKMLPLIMDEENEDIFKARLEETIEFFANGTVSEEAVDYAQNRNVRLTQLKKLGGSAVPSFEPLILKNDLWRYAVTYYDDAAFAEFLENEAAGFIKSMKVIEKMGHQNRQGFFDQILLKYGESLLRTKYDDGALKTELDSLFEDYNQHKFAHNPTIEESIREMKKGTYGEYVKKHFILAAQETPDGILTNKTWVAEHMKMLDARIKVNEEKCDAFFKAEFESDPQYKDKLTKLRTTYVQMTEKLILSEEITDSELQTLKDKLLILDEIEESKTELTLERMRKREEMQQTIESYKEEGREIAEQNEAELSKTEEFIDTAKLEPMPETEKKELKKSVRNLVREMPAEVVIATGKNRATLGREVFAYLRINNINGSTDEARVKDCISDFVEKQLELAKFKQLRDSLADHPTLAAEAEQSVRELSFGVYSRSKVDYSARIASLTEYYKKAVVAIKLFENEIEATVKRQKDESEENFAFRKKRLLVGLYEVFYANLWEKATKLNVESLKNDVKLLLSTKLSREYICDSSSVFGNVSASAVKAGEVTTFAVVDRKQFERVLREEAKAVKEDISDFGAEEMRLLGIALNFTELLGRTKETEDEKFRSEVKADAVNDELRLIKLADYRKAIGDYTKGGGLDVNPDYRVALARIFKKDKKGVKVFDKERFKQACSFVMAVKALRDTEGREPHRFGDSPDTSLKLARKALGAKALEVTSVDKFKEYITEYVPEAEKYSDRQLRILILVLQDRSAVDLTRRVSAYARSKGAMVGVVDAELREEMLADVAKEQSVLINTKVTKDMVVNAVKQLHSFQISDKRDYGKVNPTFADLVDTRRKTDVDKALLKRAISFTEELLQENERLKAVRLSVSAEMIEKSGIAPAVEELKKISGKPVGAEQFDAFIRAQAEADGQLAIYSGFASLTAEEKKLFLKALSHRDLLDISKKGINANRLGQVEREYVNPMGRFALLDEYVASGNVAVSEKVYEEAYRGAISTQLDDSLDFTKKVSFEKPYTHQMNALKRPRTTAVDWKLVQRALQLVTRADNERRTQIEQDILGNQNVDNVTKGTFKTETNLLRKNLHSSGVRFTRFIANRAAEEIIDLVPPTVQTLVRVLIPKEWSNEVNGFKAFGGDDDDDFGGEQNILMKGDELFEKGSELVDTVNSYVNEDQIVGAIADKVLAEDGVIAKAREKIGNMADTVGDIGDHKGIAMSIAKEVELSVAAIMARKEKKGDADRVEEARKKMVEEGDLRAVILEQAASRNATNTKLGSHMSAARAVDNMFLDSAGMIEKAIEKVAPMKDPMQELVSILVKESIHLVNFIRGVIHDRINIEKSYNITESVEAYKQKLRDEGFSEEAIKKSEGRFNFYLKATGFQNLTELGIHVGMNITQTLLFAASDFNTLQTGMKLLARMTLRTLGCAGAIGMTTNEAAEAVFGKLMGEDR